MLLHEIFSLFESIDLLLMEGFKDDMYNLYPEAKNDDKFNNAIKIFNSNENKIKDAVKKEIKAGGIEIKGNIASAIKNKCADAASFVTLIKTLSEKLKKEKTESTEKRKKLEQNKSHQLRTKISNEYGLIRTGKLDVSPTDYWMIPCHTFEEAHDYSIRFAGNLPRLSKEEITEKYGIITPKPATHYETDQTPAEFLNFMKNEDRFFMAPSWCIAANNGYFSSYKLKTSEDESALCYIIISKKYPNVRFCITLEANGLTLKGDLIYQKLEISEVRDPWQIGGGEKIETGLEMMRLAFGEDETEKIKQKVLAGTVHRKLSNIVNGELMFYENEDINEITSPMSNLKDGKGMFKCSISLKKFASDMPKLENGWEMFYKCYDLETVSSIGLSSLRTGYKMFYDCKNLREFNVEKLPSLKTAREMFYGTNIDEFHTSMPKLNFGGSMFHYCKNLNKFEADMPSLEDGTFMFDKCGQLTHFKRQSVIIKRREAVCLKAVSYLLILLKIF